MAIRYSEKKIANLPEKSTLFSGNFDSWKKNYPE